MKGRDAILVERLERGLRGRRGGGGKMVPTAGVQVCRDGWGAKGEIASVASYVGLARRGRLRPRA